jgi:hypothetical protein
MEKPAFISACLADVKVIMAIMCVPVVELLCQMMTGWIPVPKCLPPNVSGCL